MTSLEPTDGMQPQEVLPTPNLPLLRKVFDQIVSDPDHWDQGTWAIDERHRIRGGLGTAGCGTAFCFAGWAVEMTVGTAVDAYGKLVPDNGETAYFDVEAQRQLGLTDNEANELFHANNTVNDLRRALNGIAARAGERL